jgi:predicted dehydrogenase
MEINPTDLNRGVSRRRFLAGAALSGAAAITFPRMLAQPAEEVGGEPVTSMARSSSPSKPGLPPLAPPDKQPPTLEIPKPERKLGWAIVGLGELALEEILPAFGACKKSRLVALVSGHPDKARQLADVHGIDRKAIYDYANFDSIRDNSEIDVVYIVLPNSMHAEYTNRALHAGKHVLCEKPMAVTIAECESMIQAADKANRKLGVAYRLHYEPMNLAVMEMCRQKTFGTIKTFTGSNCQTTQAPNIRLSSALGGGPVGDLGIYCINAARYTIGEEPIEAIAIKSQPKSEPRFREVPESVSFLLRYASGAIAECQCSFGTARSSSYQVLCENGSITMNPAYTYTGLRLFTDSADGGTPVHTEYLIEPINQFAAEMDTFSDCISLDRPVPTPGDLGLRDIRIILAVLESVRQGGRPVAVG